MNVRRIVKLCQDAFYAGQNKGGNYQKLSYGSEAIHLAICHKYIKNNSIHSYFLLTIFGFT